MNLRRTTSPQIILGRKIPEGTFVACSPVVTARDPNLFPQGDKFIPQRWLSSNFSGNTTRDEGEDKWEAGYEGTFDEEQVKKVHRTGSSIQFGKGQHACLGEKLGRMMVIEILWDAILGTSSTTSDTVPAGEEENKGFDIEIVSGVRSGVVGVDGVGVEANWAQENLGTPFEMGEPVMVRFHKRI
jgi:cytochrome P450